MKRLLIAALALSTLVACSNGSDTEDTSSANVETAVDEEMTEEEAREIVEDSELYKSSKESSEAYSDAVEEYNSEDETSELDRAIENISEKKAKKEEEVAEMASEYVGKETYVDYNTTMDTVNISIGTVKTYKSAGETRLSVKYHVENTVNEEKKLPLLDSVIITDNGFQTEGDRLLSEEPEWELMGATKSSGTVVFNLENEDMDAINTVTLIIPGVDFQKEYEERIEIDLNDF